MKTLLRAMVHNADEPIALSRPVGTHGRAALTVYTTNVGDPLTSADNLAHGAHRGHVRIVKPGRTAECHVSTVLPNSGSEFAKSISAEAIGRRTEYAVLVVHCSQALRTRRRTAKEQGALRGYPPGSLLENSGFASAAWWINAERIFPGVARDQRTGDLTK